MTLTLSPRESTAYHATTQTDRAWNHASKYCRGCKSPRSAGQWDEGAEVCRTCVRRGVK
jgi:hypothetical protein